MCYMHWCYVLPGLATQKTCTLHHLLNIDANKYLS